MNQPWNAESVKFFTEEQAKKEKQIQTQMNELHKQTLTLSNLKDLTQINIECVKNIVSLTSENTKAVKQIAEMTQENQKSSSRQFKASMVISVTALIISIVTLIVTCFK